MPDDGVDYAGESVTATWPREHFQPLEYVGMDLGPFTMTTTVQEGETPEEAMRRAMKRLDRMANEVFEDKLQAFLDRVGAADKAVRRGKRS